ncbi:tetratricopeptide repeat-containing sensor histidine kinase [Chryseolinea sp. T2]|uniref:tetratricopeptide repeat-containing sensor histidine kinase n=1 Tax=Chryseolinea sp. T2 TaxID=3129255 RepID=UPI0030774B9C
MEHVEIETLLDQAYATRGNDIHGSIQMADEALRRCHEVQNHSGKAKAENLLGLFHLVKGEFEKSRTFSESALAYFTDRQDIKGIADANYNLASIYYRTNDYHKGLRILLECLKAYRSIDDLHNQARVLIPIGTVYEYFGDYEHAAEAYLQCIQISKEVNDLNLESNAYNPLAGIFLKRNEIDRAFELIQKSISIKTMTGDKRGLAFAHYTRGKGHLRKQELENALEDFNVALTITVQAADRLGQGMVLNKMGSAWLAKNDLHRARRCFLQAEEVARRHNITFVLSRAHYNLYLVMKAANQPVEALSYLEQSIKMKDAVVNKETFNIIKSYDSLMKIEALEHEARLQKQKHAIIEQKNAELDSFFYRVSHDLKGPLSSLLGLHNLVQTEVGDNKALKFFDLYNGQVNRMNNIVMGLINLTQIKNTKQLKAKIDFNKLVDECVESCHYLDQSTNVVITKNIEQVEFESEWAIINSILQNLIENAIKYGRTDITPKVDISIFAEGNQLVIEVKDNGQGIPEQHVNFIFDMFYRANDKVKGSGLGLYILKRAVERLHGTIAVDSELNVGSVFTVKLALADHSVNSSPAISRSA